MKRHTRTLDEFIEVLGELKGKFGYKVDKDWTLDLLRCEEGDCPILAVFFHLAEPADLDGLRHLGGLRHTQNGSWSAAADLLNLPKAVAKQIVRAADNREGHLVSEPALGQIRARMEVALGLREPALQLEDCQ